MNILTLLSCRLNNMWGKIKFSKLIWRIQFAHTQYKLLMFLSFLLFVWRNRVNSNVNNLITKPYIDSVINKLDILSMIAPCFYLNLLSDVYSMEVSKGGNKRKNTYKEENISIMIRVCSALQDFDWYKPF